MPRAEPSPHDATALLFLDAAAELIDAELASDQPARLARVRALKFPPALDWIRIEDVVAVAAARPDGTTASKKAFRNRWRSKDAFLRDAVLHTILYRDNPNADPSSPDLMANFFSSGTQSMATEILHTADAVYAGLLDHPRSYLLAHIGPTLSQLPELQAEMQDAAREALRSWAEGYAQVLGALGLTFRPGWTLPRVALALQSILDGFVLRARISPDEMAGARWGTASLFADTVLAFVAGTLDVQKSGLSTRTWLDQVLPEFDPTVFENETEGTRLAP